MIEDEYIILNDKTIHHVPVGIGDKITIKLDGCDAFVVKVIDKKPTIYGYKLTFEGLPKFVPQNPSTTRRPPVRYGH